MLAQRTWQARRLVAAGGAVCVAAPPSTCLALSTRPPLLTPAPSRPPPPLAQYEVLTRAADGDEGGRHQLIAATVANGNLYLIKIQIGDKRWFKGAKKDAIGAWDSFTVV